MEDEKSINEFEQTDNTEEQNKAKEQAIQQLKKLNEYVQQMAYNPIEPQRATVHTEALSKAPKKYILGTYADHKDNFKPKERSERIKRIVQKHTPMTIADFEEFIRKHHKKQAQYEKDKKQQQINYQETLLKLQKQCENQLMNAIVHKFAKTVSKKACSIVSPSSAQTESHQRLQNSLVCNMILDLEVPNQQQSSKNLTVYTKLAAVLADFIFQALFLANNWEDENLCEDDQEQHLQPRPTKGDLVIKLRALRAAKKKLYYLNRQKNSKGCAVLSHRLNK